ncbi:MAG TPA: hypothetical protein PKY13_15790 [Microthrixaceae bacterium]|nr:hypothetical protein [Microthrixaceae bacterium]
MAARYWGPMGFNPNRVHKKRASDYVLVAAAVAICIAALIWALLG